MMRKSTSLLFLALPFFSCHLRKSNQNSTVRGSENATQMVNLLDSNCGAGGCHTAEPKLSFDTLSGFADATAPIERCLNTNSCYATDLTETAAKRCLDLCFKSSGTVIAFGGFFNATIKSGISRRLLTKAQANAEIVQATETHLMPPSYATYHTMTEEQLRAVSGWLESQSPVSGEKYVELRAVRPPGGGTANYAACDSIATGIVTNINPAYVRSDLEMFGCPSGGFPADPLKCMSDRPSIDLYSNSALGMPKHKVIMLREGIGSSSFWSRSSPDGRFVASGNGKIADLTSPTRTIKNVTDWDPVFFPDNEFFSSFGSVCRVSILKTKDAVGSGDCPGKTVGGYASAGLNSDGTMLIVKGPDTYNGGGPQDNDVSVATQFGLTVNIYNKSTGDHQDIKKFDIPGEADFLISPSGKLTVSRFVREGRPAYRVRLLKPDGATIDPTSNDTAGTICMSGEKGMISFDDRFVTFHHHVDGAPYDAGAPTGGGTANIFVYDLKAKKGYRVTSMPTKSAALFPHFRADGWLYFLIKDYQSGKESVAASNIAVLLQQN